ncbi:MAG: hypothetical protein KIS79_06285 [Burkholderiales bacterium]|nr:hypothetical protein [Burkholderiales bacterium]
MRMRKSEFARKHGWVRSNINKLERKGLIVVVDGWVDVERTEALLAARLHMPAPRMRRDTATDAAWAEYRALRTRREEVKARLEQLKLDVATGAAVPRAQVLEAVFNIGRYFRDALAPIPDRIAQPIVGVSNDAAAIRAILIAEYAPILAEVEARLAAIAGPVSPDSSTRT